MKIVQINAVYGFGSTGIIVQDLQTICECNGIECIVAYSQSKSPVNKGYKIGNWFSNKIHALLSRISGKQGYFSILPTWNFLRFLDSYKPNIIHLHNLHGSYINIPMLLKYVARKEISVVVTLHDCWFYTGGCSHYTNSKCYKWQEKCGKCPRRYQETPAYLWDSSSKILMDRQKLFQKINNLTIVGVSNWITNEGHKNIFRSNNCLTIHNGIDTKFFHPINSNFRKKLKLEHKKIILAPANKWFLEVNRETFDLFASKLTDEIRLVFIGNGCDKSLLTDKMINYGFISSKEEIRDIYNAADVLVNCTREESLSLLNLEVQACGTPVVTYSNTGVKETVDGICGFSIANGNAQALWEKTQEVLNKGKNYYRNGCLNWISQQYDKEKNYINYYNLYKEIMK